MKVCRAQWTLSVHRHIRCMLGVFSPILLALLVGCGSVAPQGTVQTELPPAAEPVVGNQIFVVQRGDLIEEAQLVGQVATRSQHDLFFSRQGTLANVYVRATEPVTKGQLLAELAQADSGNDLLRAQLLLEEKKLDLDAARQHQSFAIQRAQANLNEARTRLRVALTVADRLLAEQGIRQAEIALAEAQAPVGLSIEKAIARAQLDVDEMQANINAGRLYSPTDGTIAAIALQPGADVGPATLVMSVVDPANLELRIDQTRGIDTSHLHVHQLVGIRFARYPDREVQATVEQVPGPERLINGVPAGQTPLRLSFDHTDLDIQIGDQAQMTLTLGEKKNVLWLPPEAIRVYQDTRYVIVQDGDQQRRVDITVGISRPDRVEITSGLEEFDRVIGP